MGAEYITRSKIFSLPREYRYYILKFYDMNMKARKILFYALNYLPRLHHSVKTKIYLVKIL